MSDPLEQAIEQGRFAIVSQPGWANNSCVPCNDCLRGYLRAVLPHLRRMHFQEAAELLDMEAERMRSIVQSGEWQGAASFLRGIE